MFIKNSKNRIKHIILLLYFIILFSYFLIPESSLLIIKDGKIEGDISLKNLNLKSSKISKKIYIDGNQGWIDFRNAGNCTGSGTYSDPYIIKDLVIDGESSGNCILIENSDGYFLIQNCTLYNSSV